MNLFTSMQIPNRGLESFTTLYENTQVKIEQINSNEVKKGAWYEQDHEEWVTLLQGEAVLEFENMEQYFSAGDTFFIEKHRRHRLLHTSSDAIWLAVHIF